MRGLRITEWGGPLEPFEVPTPIPGPDAVLVRVIACGIGLTVLNYLGGQLADEPLREPRVPGHELVGTIEVVGPGVAAARVGDLVTAHFYLFCGTCRRCLAGLEPLCENLRGQLGVQCDGGYAEYVVLPARNALRLPDGIDPIEATVVPDAVATPVHVARRAGISPGERVAVVGAGGGVGIHMTQVARVFGAEVAGLDVVEEKLEFLERELGVIPVRSGDFDAIELPASWNRQLDVVVDFFGRPQSLAWALRTLGRNGRPVVVATFREIELPVSPRELVLRQLSVLGSRYASRYELGLAADLVNEGRVRPVISRRVGIDGVLDVHAELERGTLLGRGALMF